MKSSTSLGFCDSEQHATAIGWTTIPVFVLCLIATTNPTKHFPLVKKKKRNSASHFIFLFVSLFVPFDIASKCSMLTQGEQDDLSQRVLAAFETLCLRNRTSRHRLELYDNRLDWRILWPAVPIAFTVVALAAVWVWRDRESMRCCGPIFPILRSRLVLPTQYL